MSESITPSDIGAYLSKPGEAEGELLKIFSANEPLVILDVGCCEGEDSVRYARRFPRARIYSFEPLPINQNLARRNFERYSISNAELVPLALANAAGKAELHVSSGKPENLFSGANWNYGNKSSSLLAPAGKEPMFGWIEFRETITVETDTLDAFCRSRAIERIDFIHMDVQGAEFLVLSGAQDMLPRTLALWLEVSDERLYKGQKIRVEIENYLSAQGFRLGFEVRRGVEGDQFYVNRRFMRTWPYIARSILAANFGGVRRRIVRWKRKLLEPASR